MRVRKIKKSDYLQVEKLIKDSYKDSADLVSADAAILMVKNNLGYILVAETDASIIGIVNCQRLYSNEFYLSIFVCDSNYPSVHNEILQALISKLKKQTLLKRGRTKFTLALILDAKDSAKRLFLEKAGFSVYKEGEVARFRLTDGIYGLTGEV